MKKVLVLIVLFLSIIMIPGCDKKENDAIRFKKEYESLNGTQSSNGKTIRSVSISENNPFIYKGEDDIVNMMNNKESFLVYFGFAKCPWCRSMLETLTKVAYDDDLDTIYYVDVLDIRDTIDSNNNKTKEGTDGYYKLLELMDNVLANYDIKDNNGNSINVNEKRIYAPNIVAVIDGKAYKMVTGISDKQKDGYMELTPEMKDDMYNSLNEVVSIVQEKLATCNTGC